jgi:hypothetical protein
MDNTQKTKIYPIAFISLFFILLLFLGLFRFESVANLSAEKFHLRTKLISWAMNIKFLVIRDNFFNNMYTADNLWLNYTGELSIDDAQNAIPFNNEQLGIIHEKLVNIQKTLNESGIKFYLVIPPNKNTIYPDDVTRIAPKIQPMSRLDQLIEYELDHEEINVIDIRTELFDEKTTNQVFYSTDTHWNDYGSWVGYYKIMNEISKDFPSIVVNSLEEFDIGYKTYSGDLSIKSGSLKIEETTQTLSLKNPRTVKHDKTELNNGLSVIRSQIDAPELPRALVFRDSFYTQLHGKMSQHFSTSICVWSFVFDYSIVDEVKPDLVIYEITERYINQLLRLP